MDFVTSDSHYSHENIISFSKRPFSNTDEMNEAIIKNYNRVVSSQDRCFILGDFTWDAEKGIRIWNRLNGEKILIRGNHDSKFIKVLPSSVQVYDIFEIYYNKILFVMCHFPMLTWNKSHFDDGYKFASIMLHGHHHSNIIQETFPNLGRMVNVCVELNNYTPISFDEVIAKASKTCKRWDAAR